MPARSTQSVVDALSTSLIEQVDGFFSQLQASATRPITKLSGDDEGNFVLVLYSMHGSPLRVVAITDQMGKRDSSGIMNEARALGEQGVVGSYRTIEVGTARIAHELERLMRDLFGSVLPWSTTAVVPGSAADVAAGESEAPRKRRGRPPGSGTKKRRGRPAGTKKRGPGRPRKNATAEGEGERSSEATTTRKRRGRPPGSGTKKRGPGRPRKSASAEGEGTTEAATTRKRRGRPPGSGTKKRGPGRPRKNAAAGGESTTGSTEAAATKKRRGRPPGSGTKKRGPGRPRKNAA